MRTKRINQYRQQQFYHLNTARVRRTQTMPKQYIRQKPVTKQDELTFIEYDISSYKEMLKEIANNLEQIEKKRKELVIIFVESYFGRPLTNEEKQKLLVLI